MYLDCARREEASSRGWIPLAVSKNDFNFYLNYNYSKAGAAGGCISPNYIDDSWRTLDLPHDWVVEQDFANIKDEALQDHGFKAVGALFPKASIGWYRKTFAVDAKDSGNKFNVHFDERWCRSLD